MFVCRTEHQKKAHYPEDRKWLDWEIDARGVLLLPQTAMKMMHMREVVPLTRAAISGNQAYQLVNLANDSDWFWKSVAYDQYDPVGDGTGPC